ncbi:MULTISPECIES: hypothetical protein [unclassified Nocardioides]|uniref:hypothetical protein n=1 Tax=unclassified Nocardioides TaxID=2615069 RepID=UPI0000570F15|nr:MULTISPECIES: hypothetical protein [unclassified Nocardioides]ABL80802.1 hypothetical protein Noca_1288 [Nocardioides sp. JS614]
MTWKSFHSRGEILRDVITTANTRRDGILPMDVDGVAETFGDPLTLLGALQLRWHTRLAGRIERELGQQPMDLEGSVITAWQATADELPGVLAIIDHYRAEPLDAAMAEAMAKSADKEHVLLAMMAGRVSAPDRTAVRVGAAIEAHARATYRPVRPVVPSRRASHHPRLLARLKAALAA